MSNASTQLVDRGAMLSEAALKTALLKPSVFPEFLRHHQMDGKFQRVADKHHIDVHQHARMVIVAVEEAANRQALIAALKESTELTKKATLASLVLDKLIAYSENDKSARSRDKGVQAYLASHNISGSDAASTIGELGGIQATYAALRSERNPAKPPKKKRKPPLRKADLLRACPKGGELLAFLRVDPSGNAEITKYRIMTAFGPDTWPKILKAAEEAETTLRQRVHS